MTVHPLTSDLTNKAIRRSTVVADIRFDITKANRRPRFLEPESVNEAISRKRGGVGAGSALVRA